jgi:hypothetical protein
LLLFAEIDALVRNVTVKHIQVVAVKQPIQTGGGPAAVWEGSRGYGLLIAGPESTTTKNGPRGRNV